MSRRVSRRPPIFLSRPPRRGGAAEPAAARRAGATARRERGRPAGGGARATPGGDRLRGDAAGGIPHLQPRMAPGGGQTPPRGPAPHADLVAEPYGSDV